ncbi:IS200/IS605 family transposase, partial [Rhodococcus koreensis]
MSAPHTAPGWEPTSRQRSASPCAFPFVTKYRRGAFTDPMLTRCEQIMAEVCDKFGATLTEFTGETDHVHLLIHYPP